MRFLKYVLDLLKGGLGLVKYIFGFGRTSDPEDVIAEQYDDFEQARSYCYATLRFISPEAVSVEMLIMHTGVQFVRRDDSQKSVVFTTDEIEQLIEHMHPDETANYVEAKLLDLLN